MRRVLTLFMFFVVASVAVMASPVNAQVKYKETYPVISVTPNPVGVGQTVWIIGGLPDQTVWPKPGWYNITVVIKRPDNVTEKKYFNTFTTGIGGVTYVPPKPGTYKIHIEFPEQVCEVDVTPLLAPPGTPPLIEKGTIMKASKSRVVELIVKEEPVPTHPGFPLPQEYWTRPVDSQLREWAWIAGNWLGMQEFAYYTRYVPYNQGPEAPHIVWAKVLDDGGLIGGSVGGQLADYLPDQIADLSYEHGDAYEGKFVSPIVIHGILFYNLYPAQDVATATMLGGVPIEQKVVAVDIHTGEELWRRTLGDNERLAFGQIMYWRTMNMEGAFAYIWTTVGTTWKAYDPFTGRWEYNIANVPSGTRVRGPNGEILIYQINLQAGWMALWNSTKVVQKTFLDIFGPYFFYTYSWRPHGITFDGRKGYEWNKTIPRFGPLFSVEAVIPFDTVLISNTQWSGGAAQKNPVFAAISVKPGDIGRLKFNVSWPLPKPDVHVDFPGTQPIDIENRVFVVAVKETREYYGFDLDSGIKRWGPTTHVEPDFNVYTILYLAPWGQAVVAYGKLFTGGYGGEINAYDIKTGKHLWSYTVTDPYNEFKWGNWPTPICLITDGKIYIGHMEHSGNPPLPRGAPFVCLNATTGEEIFRVDGLVRTTRWGGQPIIADSKIIWFDTYSNMIFAIGKGPTAATVTVEPKVVALGESIVIEGTILDVSPGTKDSKITLRFPNGVPAVADECMGEWMLYVYKQFPRPTNMKGVWVKLDAINVYTGEYIDIGGTHTDPYSGKFTVMWSPPKGGLWWIIASFPGTKSYWPSFAQTSVGVTGAPAAPAAPAYTTMDIAIMAAVIIAIAIGIYSIYDHRKLKK